MLWKRNRTGEVRIINAICRGRACLQFKLCGQSSAQGKDDTTEGKGLKEVRE